MFQILYIFLKMPRESRRARQSQKGGPREDIKESQPSSSRNEERRLTGEEDEVFSLSLTPEDRRLRINRLRRERYRNQRINETPEQK